MRTPNSKCEICGKEKYRRPFELKKAKHLCCRECRSELYKKYKNYDSTGLDIGRGWNKGMSKANGDVLKYGKPRSLKTIEAISKANKGKVFTKEHCRNISKGKIALFDKIGRVKTEGRNYLDARWRRAILKRDDYTCQACDSKKRPQADHIMSWKKFPEIRYDLDNGTTLCYKCHLKTPNYGNRQSLF